MSELPEGPGPRTEAVIFDMDGVIVDTEPWWHATRVTWAERLGRTWTEDDSRACMGLNSRDWAQVMHDRMQVDLSVVEIESEIVGRLVARYHHERVPEVPGAVEAVIRIADQMPAAIGSSSHRDVIDAALRSVGLQGRLRAVVSSDDVPRGKPSPDVYLEAASRLGVEPHACVVVEDSLNGVVAGKAAGMTVVLVPNPSVPPAARALELADRVIARLVDLDPRLPLG